MHSIASPKQSWTLPLDAAPGGTQRQARAHHDAPHVSAAAPPTPLYTLFPFPPAWACSLQAPKTSAAHLARRQSRGNSPRRGAREPVGPQLPARTRARRTHVRPRARRTCMRRRRWGREGPMPRPEEGVDSRPTNTSGIQTPWYKERNVQGRPSRVRYSAAALGRCVLADRRLWPAFAGNQRHV